MLRAKGNAREADYLLNCGVYEYYWRLHIYNQYAIEMKKQFDQVNKK